jgi:predicted membrane metal-binding protein
MQLFDRQTLALDALGLALIFELLWHPFSIESVGFQLSYGTTFFLVQYYRPLKEKLSLALRLCSRYELNSYSTRDLFGLYLLVALQKLFILNVCTCLFSYPLILFHFHELSLSYLIYNFFFPFFALISILFGLFTFVTTLFAPISQWLTLQILDLLVFVPEGFNIKLNLRTMPLVLLYLYYPLLFLVMQKDYRLQPIFRACRFKFSLLVQRGYLLFKK